MELFKFPKGLSEREKLSVKFLTACLFLVLIYQTYHTYFSSTIMLMLDIIIILLGTMGCWVFMLKYSIPRYAKWFLILIPYFLIVGMAYGDRLMSGHNLSIVLEQDLRYVLLFLIGGVFAANSKMMSSFHWLMKWLAIISIVFGVLGLFTFDFQAAAIQERTGTWTISYYYWWASVACFLYWSYYFLFTKRHKAVGLGVLLSYLVLGALFVKRSCLVNAIVIFFVYALLNRGGKLKTFTKVLLIALFAVVMVYLIAPGLFNTILDTYSSRIESVQDFEEFDRNEETWAYFDHSSAIQRIFGNGIGHFPQIVGYRDYDYQINALHIGWANIIYKGGIIYALFYLLLLIQVLKRLFRAKRLNQYQMVCLGVAISSFVSLLYEGSWTYSIQPVCISAPIFYLLSGNKNEFD